MFLQKVSCFYKMKILRFQGKTTWPILKLKYVVDSSVKITLRIFEIRLRFCFLFFQQDKMRENNYHKWEKNRVWHLQSFSDCTGSCLSWQKRDFHCVPLMLWLEEKWRIWALACFWLQCLEERSGESICPSHPSSVCFRWVSLKGLWLNFIIWSKLYRGQGPELEFPYQIPVPIPILCTSLSLS